MTTAEPSGIGRRIFRFRKEQGMSAQDLADEIKRLYGAGNMSRTTISKIENGYKQDVTVKELIQLSRALGVSPTMLLCDCEQPYELSDTPGCDGMQNQQVYEWMNISVDPSLKPLGPSVELKKSSTYCRIRDMHELLNNLYQYRSYAKKSWDMHKTLRTYEDDPDVLEAWLSQSDHYTAEAEKAKRKLEDTYHMNMHPAWMDSGQ